MTGPTHARIAPWPTCWTAGPIRTTPTVVFGRGCLDELPDQVRRIADGPVLIVTDRGLVDAGVVQRVTDELSRAGIRAEVWDDVQPEPPTISVDACAEAIRQADPAVVLGVGGGSAMDTSQIAACVATNGGMAEDWIGVEVLRQPGVPTISIPTTAGTASEVTGNAVMVLPDRSNKMTVVSPFIYPRTALIDPALTDSVPAHITAATGMDTFCHAAESFITGRATQHTRQPAADALRRTLEFLPRAVADGTDREARDQMSYACLQAGFSLANAGVILVHGLAHAIGARGAHSPRRGQHRLPAAGDAPVGRAQPGLDGGAGGTAGRSRRCERSPGASAGGGGGDGAAGGAGWAADAAARGRRGTRLAAGRCRGDFEQHPRGIEQPGAAGCRRTDRIARRGLLGECSARLAMVAEVSGAWGMKGELSLASPIPLRGSGWRETVCGGFFGRIREYLGYETRGAGQGCNWCGRAPGGSPAGDNVTGQTDDGRGFVKRHWRRERRVETYAEGGMPEG